jgi:hypothetical protein
VRRPAHFYPRRHLFVLKVELPKNEQREAAHLDIDLQRPHQHSKRLAPTGMGVDDGVIQMNIGLVGGAPPVDPPNTTPKITGSGYQTIDLGKPATLAVSARDDGIPKPRARSTQSAKNAAAAPAPRVKLGLRKQPSLCSSLPAGHDARRKDYLSAPTQSVGLSLGEFTNECLPKASKMVLGTDPKRFPRNRRVSPRHLSELPFLSEIDPQPRILCRSLAKKSQKAFGKFEVRKLNIVRFHIAGDRGAVASSCKLPCRRAPIFDIVSPIQSSR